MPGGIGSVGDLPGGFGGAPGLGDLPDGFGRDGFSGPGGLGGFDGMGPSAISRTERGSIAQVVAVRATMRVAAAHSVGQSGRASEASSPVATMTTMPAVTARATHRAVRLGPHQEARRRAGTRRPRTREQQCSMHGVACVDGRTKANRASLCKRAIFVIMMPIWRSRCADPRDHDRALPARRALAP